MRIDKYELMGALIGGSILFIVIAIILTLKYYPNVGFCKRYFPDVPTWECALGDKYKYDND